MAGQAAKKAQQRTEKAGEMYFPLVMGVNALYILLRVILRFSTFGWWNAAGLVLTSALYKVCYVGCVHQAGTAQLTGGAGYYFDVLCLLIACQLGCCYSDKAWFILLLIPGYAVFVGGQALLAARAAARGEAPPEKDEKELERERKREAKKQKIKYRR